MKKTLKGVNLELLKQIPGRSDKFRGICEILSERQRSRGEIRYFTVKELGHAKGLEIAKHDYVEFFQALEKTGAGKLIMKNGSYVFEWTVPLKSVGCVALGLTDPASLPTKPRRKKANQSYIESVIHPLVEAAMLPPSHYPSPIPEQEPVRLGLVTIRKNGIEIDVNYDSITPLACEKLNTLLSSLR